MFTFNDKVVIITGANGSLGQTVSRAFYESGARLILAGRKLERLEEAFPELAEDERTRLLAADVTDAEGVDEMISRAHQVWGQIDVLANIAGGFRAGTPVHELSLKTWEFMLKLNANSVFYTSRAVIPHMLAQGSGKIINVASRAAYEGAAGMAAYSVGKTAVVRLTESIAAEVKEKGINVNCIIPGTIDTPDNRAAMPDADTSKWVQPATLADVFLFLASNYARGIHGATVPVEGPG